jgi:hypothetical protein
MSLQWHAGDLLVVAAHRLSLYLQLVDAPQHRRLLEKYDVEQRSGAVALFTELLPPDTPNKFKIAEPSLAYVLRHTQLLPRHAVDIFNWVIGAAIDPATGVLGPIETRHVESGISHGERNIYAGVVDAYRHRYPVLDALCRAAIPQLPRRFSDSELHVVYTRHAKAVLKETPDTEHELDYHAFKKMLIDVGAVGRFRDETQIYYEAEFTYTAPADLVVGVEDSLCLHPLFSGRYPRIHENGKTVKFVYPSGSSPEA